MFKIQSPKYAAPSVSQPSSSHSSYFKIDEGRYSHDLQEMSNAKRIKKMTFDTYI